ncbi:MAG: haloacid dehalogenase-like hydrolase [Candidatus Aenigmarchaeota archaeon]|nr:haloacid dehalogenase-like hydrolase [Candidatus Aenigmarchaeota archaeon]
MHIPVFVTTNRRPEFKHGLFAADYEGTLLAGEFMEALGNALAGVYTELDGSRVSMKAYMEAITQRGMRGELPFDASLRLRLEEITKYMNLEEMKAVVAGIPLRTGAREALMELEKYHDIIVVSGGIYPLVEHSLSTHGIGVDYVAASGIKCNGRLQDVYPLTDKSLPLKQLMQQHPYGWLVAMGDGANDRQMKGVANRFIWVCPKDGLAEDRDIVIGGDLSVVPQLLRELYGLK